MRRSEFSPGSLPWGIIPQRVVKERLVPLAMDRKRHNSNAENVLTSFDQSFQDVQIGAELAFRFVADVYTKGDAVFETNYLAQVERPLARVFDWHIAQIPRALSTVEIHDVHDVQLVTALQLVFDEGFRAVDEAHTPLNAAVLWPRLALGRITGKDHGIRLAVEVLLKTSETASFGPSQNVKMDDATHLLWFVSTKDSNLRANSVDFELANFNECLNMIPDWPLPTPAMELSASAP